MSQRVSLTDIARKTGFSKSAVSIALRGDAGVSAGVRQEIRNAAAEMGYRPSPILASLASKHFSVAKKRTGTPLAFLHFGETKEQRAHEKEATEEATNHAMKLGYRVEVFHVGDFRSGEHLSRVLLARGVEGILLFLPKLVEGVDWSAFSVVSAGGGFASPDPAAYPLNRTAVDHYGLILRAWSETWKRGYRRIGFVLFRHSPLLTDDETRRGAAEVCRLRIPRHLRIPVFEYEAPQAGPRSVVEDWVRRYRPDAVIGFNATILFDLQQAGFRVPEDLGFVSLHTDKGHSPEEKGWADSVSGMAKMRMEEIYAALELLDQQIRHHHYGLNPRARTLMISSEWVEGSTLPWKTSTKGDKAA